MDKWILCDVYTHIQILGIILDFKGILSLEHCVMQAVLNALSFSAILKNFLI